MGDALAAVAPIMAGLVLAPSGQRPDVLIGRGVDLVAVRMPGGGLSALAGRGSTFELARWLEHDGDGRPAAEVTKGEGFRCDALGCTARVKGVLVAVARSPAALRDDCAAGGIVALKFARPPACGAAVVIDPAAISARGAHAITIDAGKMRLQTVADGRGARPWVVPARSEAAAGDDLAEDWPARGRRQR